MDINGILKEIIAEQLRTEPSEIGDTADVIEVLGADSLDVVEILMSVEEQFAISVPDVNETSLSGEYPPAKTAIFKVKSSFHLYNFLRITARSQPPRSLYISQEKPLSDAIFLRSSAWS